MTWAKPSKSNKAIVRDHMGLCSAAKDPKLHLALLLHGNFYHIWHTTAARSANHFQLGPMHYIHSFSCGYMILGVKPSRGSFYARVMQNWQALDGWIPPTLLMFVVCLIAGTRWIRQGPSFGLLDGSLAWCCCAAPCFITLRPLSSPADLGKGKFSTMWEEMQQVWNYVKNVRNVISGSPDRETDPIRVLIGGACRVW
jgi:hypothetical protein